LTKNRKNFILITKQIEIMATFKIIKRIYGSELNQLNEKVYTTKEEAILAGNIWQNDLTVIPEVREARNFEVIQIY
jgi:hypothetical protein